jgi:hypothetical protein
MEWFESGTTQLSDIVWYGIARFWICALTVLCLIFLKISTVRHAMVHDLDTIRYDTTPNENTTRHDTNSAFYNFGIKSRACFQL